MKNVTNEPENPPVEVLHLSIEEIYGGLLHLREMAWMSDHKTFARLSRRQDDDSENWESRGWVRQADWESMERLKAVAKIKVKSGWKVIWHPLFNPEMQNWVKEVRFL